MLYHEKQVAALCGVHCLNTLLQGPYFSEIDLAQIAQGLDELERALIGDGALGEASGNVAMDGMFSIQVLSRALESWGLQVVSLESEEARAFKAAPTTAEAFICNLSEHWFTLRRVANGEWWNFNSLFPAPQPLSTFYLQAFLDSLRGEGWTIFVVVGKLPIAQPGALEQQHNASGRWWSPEEARAATDEAERARKRGRVTAALEGALARAGQQGGRLQLRTRGAAGTSGDGAYGNGNAGGGSGGSGDDEDEDLMAAIAASLQTHPPPPQQQQQQPGAGEAAQLGGSQAAGSGQGQAQGLGQGWQQQGFGGGHELYGVEDDDPELAMAIAASLADSAAAGAGAGAADGASGGADAGAGSAAQVPEAEPELGAEPDESEGVIEVAFRLPSGSRCNRRFALASPSSHLFAFLSPLLGVPSTQIALSTTFPKKELERSPTVSLSDLGLSNRTLLVAEPRR